MQTLGNLEDDTSDTGSKENLLSPAQERCTVLMHPAKPSIRK